MCIYETNRPEVLDPAVQSRVTRSIEFPLPTRDELMKMVEQYFNLYIVQDKPKGKGLLGIFTKQKLIDVTGVSRTHLEEIADACSKNGFVGRDVTNMIISLAQAAYADPEFKLTPTLVDRVVKEQIQKKQMERFYLEQRAQRIDKTLGRSGRYTPPPSLNDE
eukprot:TRINITY_DN46951_c0_g2_i1.p1 TRINITY_DN46951_c0_g2~~TRINITY_DN46951_c0_g2_i1.p1  ORF type:complete len:189 (+),score=17.18 TRINITY_DN46951_c0_g2_i1:82-567(+)